ATQVGLMVPSMNRIAVLITLAAFATASEARAQSASAPELKAAFLLNLAKFAEWPALAPDAPVVVCVAGDDRVAALLASTVRAQPGESRAITVVTIPGDLPTRGCQALFLGRRDARLRLALVEEASASPILTVSDAPRFAGAGGMVELFLEAGRMRFAVNVDAVGRSHVRLSSRLLGLAKIVRDTTNAQ